MFSLEVDLNATRLRSHLPDPRTELPRKMGEGVGSGDANPPKPLRTSDYPGEGILFGEGGVALGFLAFLDMVSLM